MKTKNEWRQDREYMAIVNDLLAQPAGLQVSGLAQHHHSNRLQHSIAVSPIVTDCEAFAPGLPEYGPGRPAA